MDAHVVKNKNRKFQAIKEENDSEIKERKMSVEDLLEEVDLKTENGPVRSRETQKNREMILQLSKLQHELDDWTLKIETLERKNCEKAVTLENIEQQIRHQTTALRATENSIHRFKAQYPIGRLYDKVELVTQTNDETWAQLRKVRCNIDVLRREKLVLEKSCDDDLKTLATNAKTLSVVVMETESAYQEKLVAEKQLKEAKKTLESEQLKLKIQLKEIQGIVQSDTRMTGVESPKRRKTMLNEQKNNSKEEIVADQSRKESILGIKGIQSLLRSKVNNKAWKLAKSKAVAAVSRNNTLGFEEAFVKVKDFGQGANNFNELCNNLIEVEQFNQALRKQIEEEQDKARALLASIASAQDEVSKYKQMGIETENKHEAIIRNMQNEIVLLDEQHLNLTKGLKKREFLCNEVQSEIRHIYHRLGCKNSKLAQSFKGNMGVMQCLGVIEEQVLHLLQILGENHTVAKEANSSSVNSEQVNQQLEFLSIDDDLPQLKKPVPLVGHQLRDQVRIMVEEKM